MAIKENMDLYRCEKCKKLYTSEYAANICCKQYHCRVCGKETPQYMLICDSCAEHERFEKARKMTLAEYYEEFPGNMLYYGEEFYDDIESLDRNIIDKNRSAINQKAAASTRKCAVFCMQ